MSSTGQILSVAAPIAGAVLIASGYGAPLGAALEGSTVAGVAAGDAALGVAGTDALGAAAIGAASGAVGSAASGGNVLKGAGIGGAAGGIGGYVQGSGGLSNALGLSSATDASGAASGVANGIDQSGVGGAAASGAASGFNLPSSYSPVLNGGLSGALSSAAPAASTGFSSYIPSVLGGTGANPGLGSVLGAGANLYSGIQGTAAAKANTAAEQEANNQALALQAKNYSATTANLSPYLTTGNQANTQLATDLGLGTNTSAAGFGSLTAPFTLQSLENTPGYQFQLQQGTQALNQSLGAQGQLFSGAAIKEGQQFATGLADSTYNQAYSNYLAGNNQTYNELAATSGSGQNAATNQGGFAAGLSAIGTPTLQNTGNITAAGTNAGNTAVNNSLASALGTSVGGAQPSSYGNNGGTLTPLAGGGYTMNGVTYNALGQRISG